MTEMIPVVCQGCKALVATRLATARAYKGYLQATGRPVPPALTRHGVQAGPAISISQLDAIAFCDWLGKQEGRSYRLPGMAELLALYNTYRETEVGPEGWPA